MSAVTQGATTEAEANEILAATNSLLSKRRLELVKDGTELMLKIVDEEEAQKYYLIQVFQ